MSSTQPDFDAHLVLHLLPPAVSSAIRRRRRHVPRSLRTEGFIHLCRPSQVRAVMQRHFPAQTVFALVFDRRQFHQGIEDEDLYGHGAHPHAREPLRPRQRLLSLMLHPGQEPEEWLAMLRVLHDSRSLEPPTKRSEGVRRSGESCRAPGSRASRALRSLLRGIDRRRKVASGKKNRPAEMTKFGFVELTSPHASRHADKTPGYMRTRYTAATPTGPLTLMIGERSPRLDALLDDRKQSSWAYLTALNPRSKPDELPRNRNKRKQRSLLQKLEKRGFDLFEGEGVAFDGSWREKSVLVLGISEAEACALGREFRQNAVVVGDRHGCARLCILA